MAQVTFYHVDKRPNSLKIPLSTGGVTKEVKLKNETSKFSPSFYLSDIKPTWNYLKWDGLYFYISDVITIRNNYYLINTTLDVLASYRTEILNTNAYVRYSTSDYDNFLPDDRLSVGSNLHIKTSKAQVLDVIPLNGQTTQRQGVYVVNYVTSHPTLGPSGCVFLTKNGINQLGDVINDPNFLSNMLHTNIGELVSKKLENVYDSILNCIYLPCDLWAIAGGNKRIYLGDYDTKIDGKEVAPIFTQQRNIVIPSEYLDFRQLSPYNEYYIVLPGVGIVPYNANLLINETSLAIDMKLDCLTGDIYYNIGKTSRYTGNIATNIMLSKSNHPGIIAGISGAATAIGAAALGHVGVAAASLFGASVTSAQVDSGSVGNTHSNVSLWATPQGFDLGSIYIVSIARGTNIDPSSIINTLGRPCNKVVKLNSLTGYCQTVGVSVSCNAPIEIKEQINNLLNGGVYIE